ncbi:MAG: helix-turn-helix domain-containing protein [Prevotellaceae bacterium]|nr:helix-turn-helix domain-containing protein [Prevotellaceae bacterium]
MMQAYYFLTLKDGIRFHKILGYIFIFWALSCLKDIIQTIPGFYTRQTLDYILVFDGWSAISFVCFLFELTMPGWVTLRKVAVMFIPFLIFTVLYVLFPCDAIFYSYSAFLIIFGLTIVIVGYAKARKYIEYVRDNYSNIDDIDISWIKYVYLIAFASQLLWLLVSIVSNIYFDAVYYISIIVMWHIAIYYCRGLKPIKVEKDSDDEKTSEDKTYPFAGQLEKIVEEEQLYLNPNLSLSNLVARMGTNRTYLSEYFSNVKGMTFYDYINEQRIKKKSVPMMKEHPEYTLDYIAQLSGFNSQSTFRRSFLKYTGVNPGKYRSCIGEQQ